MKVAIVTGASQGIGAGLVAGFRGAGYAVVGTSRSIGPADEPDYLTVPGDVADPAIADRVVERALERFGRIDSLVNNAGVFVAKPFTEYTADDYAAVTHVNLGGFFHITQRAIRQMVGQGGGHVVNVSTTLVERADSGRPCRGGPVAGRRVRRPRRARQCRLARRHQDARARPGVVRGHGEPAPAPPVG
jgi:NAD(P)-dependent dehydrogenase (short-subunit alcohol dehydrogenase family)